MQFTYPLSECDSKIIKLVYLLDLRSVYVEIFVVHTEDRYC